MTSDFLSKIDVIHFAKIYLSGVCIFSFFCTDGSLIVPMLEQGESAYFRVPYIYFMKYIDGTVWNPPAM